MKTKIGSALLVFPARAGMSLPPGKPEGKFNSVPRASGDEPRTPAPAPAWFKCSPRERG